MPTLSQPDIFQRIDESKVARLAQLDDAAEVHAIPFVFARVGSKLFSPVDGKPKKHANLSRLAWLTRHPAVTVLIDNYEDNWSKLWWIRLYGQAGIVDQSEPDWQTAVKSLKCKYPQYENVAIFHDEPKMLCFIIDHWKSWSAVN